MAHNNCNRRMARSSKGGIIGPGRVILKSAQFIQVILDRRTGVLFVHSRGLGGCTFRSAPPELQAAVGFSRSGCPFITLSLDRNRLGLGEISGLPRTQPIPISCGCNGPTACDAQAPRRSEPSVTFVARTHG